ncbi:MAG: hypothetical protein KDK64_01040 [Chlamydiia bacterium]|nr:hypothetical protein [Chlamydiia bacterium]
MKRFSLLLLICVGVWASPSREIVVAIDQNPSKEVPISSSNGCDISKYRPVSDKNYFFAYGELFYWKPTQNAVDYAVKGQPSEFFPQQTIGAFRGFGQYGTVQSASYDWTAGLRVGVGGLFQSRNWELDGNFTYIHPDGSDHVSKPAIDMLIGTHPFDSGNAFLARATTSIDFSYALANLLIVKRILFSEDMIFRFFMGSTGGWFDNNWKWKYFSSNNEENSFVSNWNFSGGGVRGGFQGEWYLCYGFGLGGTLSTALLYGYYENQYRMKIIAPQNLPPFFKDKSEFGDHRIVPHMQLAFGPNWGIMINKIVLKLYVQYELNLLFNLHEVHRSLQEGSIIDGRNSRYAYGNIGLQGLNFGACLAF